MEGLSFAYPSWYVLLCLLAGLGYALLLYFRDTRFREKHPWLPGALGFLRFASISLLCLLLLSPLLRSEQTERRKPVVVMAQDASQSVAMGMKDTAAFQAAWSALREQLAEQYEVQSLRFGEKIEPAAEVAFGDRKTNITEALQHVYDLYSNQNLGAVILASDGIYNQGANPVYADIKLNAPLFTVALGDTTRKKDLNLSRVFHNRLVYLGDKFSIQVDLSALRAAGSSTVLTVSKIDNKSSRELKRETIAIDKNDYFSTRELLLDADKAGVQRYRISVSSLAGEVTLANNSREIFVEVLDARQKILLLANAPHPDISAIRQSLSEGLNNEVTIAYADNFAGDIKGFDLVVLHQLPSLRHDISNLSKQLILQRKPVWFILGEQTQLARFNQTQSMLSVMARNQSVNETQASVAPDFSLFTLDEPLRRFLPNLPPLYAPFGEYTAGANTATLLYQRIGKVDTRYPLLVFGEQQGVRTAVLTATGIWQWRLFDFLDSENHSRLDQLIGKTVQYLSIKDDKRRFRVLLPKNLFDETEAVTFDAELYNQSYELVNGPDANLVVTHLGDGKEYNFTFNRTGRAYALSAGILPVGNYRFRASVNTGTEKLDFEGQFSVQPVQLEQFITTADHGMLQLLSENYGGRRLSVEQLGQLPDWLAQESTLKPIIYSTVTTRSVIHLKWIFFLILLLLSVEWFSRRYFGAY